MGAGLSKPRLICYHTEKGWRSGARRACASGHATDQSISEQRGPMAGIFQRLVQLGRAHLNDLLTQHWSGGSSAPTWETDFETYEHTQDDAFHHSSPPFEEPAPADHGLPHST